MRTLREIYLRAFELAIRAPNPPWVVMTGYNRVNDLHCSENSFLISTVLRGEWGFKGLVISDWFGTYSTAESIRAGLDLEMPVSVFLWAVDVLIHIKPQFVHRFNRVLLLLEALPCLGR